MEFTPIPLPSPAPSPKPLEVDHKPRSASSLAFPRGVHPLLTTGGQNSLRAQFSIATWLVAGAALQALLVLTVSLLRFLFSYSTSPAPSSAPRVPVTVYYALLAPLCLLAYKIATTYLVLWGYAPNHLMEGIVRGRFSALIPREQGGGFGREAGESVGGKGVTVFLLGARCNSPLGTLSPSFALLSKHFIAMFASLSRSPETYGFLGSSTYENTSDRTTNPEILYVMYFSSPEGLRAFAHGKVHTEGLDWWMRGDGAEGGKGEGGWSDLAISHEMYVVPEGGWENVYHNYAPSGFAATTHLVEEEGGVKRWVSPLVKGDQKGLKSSTSRMGFVKGPAVGRGSNMGEKM